MKNKKRLTILIGAGAVMDASKDCGKEISTKSITEDSFTKIKYDAAKELLSLIREDLVSDYSRYNKTPNFEDLFHALEILDSAYTIDSGAPEFKPMYKYLMDIKEKFKKYDPYLKGKLLNNEFGLAVSFAQSAIIESIQESVESYSDSQIPNWYETFFRNLKEHYNLDIFTLNYDTWFEQMFDSYNDGFYDANKDSQFFKFAPAKIINSESEINIHHMHGQIDFRSCVGVEDPRIMFDDQELGTIYKIKNPKFTKRELDPACGDHTTQAGDHLKSCPIITGKMKIEKTIYPPLDAYRTNFNNCIVKNSNILIIGYGFADYYIDSLLSQFHDIHGDDTRVNIVDCADSDHWRDTSSPFGMEGHKLHTIYGLCKDISIEPQNIRKYSPIFNFDNNHFHLYLKGFKNTVNEDTRNIINSYN